MPYKTTISELNAYERRAKFTFDDIAAYAKFHFKDDDGNPYIMSEYQIAAAHII